MGRGSGKWTGPSSTPGGLKGLLLLAVVVVGGIAFGQGYRYTTANLNLRAAPSSSARVLLVIPAKARVTLGSCKAGWCSV